MVRMAATVAELTSRPEIAYTPSMIGMSLMIVRRIGTANRQR